MTGIAPQTDELEGSRCDQRELLVDRQAVVKAGSDGKLHSGLMLGVVNSIVKNNLTSGQVRRNFPPEESGTDEGQEYQQSREA